MEIIFIILLAGGMIGPGVYIGIKTKRWHLLWVFLTFFVCFGLWEWHATVTTGLTVSQQVWEFGEGSPVAFWVVIGSLIISWLSLMFHFCIKKFRKN